MQEVTTGMKEKGINNNEWVRQRRLEKKNAIKTLGTGFSTVSIADGEDFCSVYGISTNPAS